MDSWTYIKIAVGFALFGANAWALPAQWKMDVSKGKSQVEFHATGNPGFLKIHGKGAVAGGNLIGKGSTAEGRVTVALAAFKTGIALRDRHMKEKYLEVGKYPSAILTLSNIEIPKTLLAGAGSAEFPFRGQLTLHGVSKEVSGTAHAESSETDILKLSAEFGIDIQDFEIPSPGFSGVTMAKKVRVRVTLEAGVSAGL